MENENLWVEMARRLVLWWRSDKPGTTMDFESAHELGGVVQMAQALLDIKEAREKMKR